MNPLPPTNARQACARSVPHDDSDGLLSRRGFLAGGVAALTAGRLGGRPVDTQARSAGGDPGAKDLRRSQLFLDDTWVEETSRLERSWEAAEIFPEPVLRPEKPWEGHQLVIAGGSVFRLADGWRLYYMTYNRPDPMRLCLALSKDGLRWERPKLGLFEHEGSKQNNIVYMPPGDQSFTAATVCHDPGDAEAPFKLLYYAAGGGKPTGEYVALSKDGLAWRAHPDPVLTTTGDQTNLMGARDHRGRFVAFLRHKNMLPLHRARSIWRSESEDFLRWSEPEPILRPDLLDGANTELYGMAGFPYGDLYLGLIERWRGNPDVFEIQLAWSHDGRQWQRPPVREPFIGPQHPWNKSWNSTVNTAPIRVGNTLRFYFGGRSRAHGQEVGQVYGAVGMATVTVDRFAAIKADYKEGRLLTRPLTWPGGDLVLNATPTRYPQGFYNGGGGAIEVEVLDEQGRPVEGFAGERRARHNFLSPFPWRTEDRPARWAEDRSLAQLAGKRIRLAFLLRDARLYSFRSSLGG